jgi:hypothetical protein
MKHNHLTTLTLTATFALAFALVFITAATASAETLPNILPLGTATEPLTYNSSSKGAGFESAALGEITATSSLGEATSTGNEGDAGTFHETYFGFNSPPFGKCTGTGDGLGIVLILGTYQLKDADLTGKLIVAVLFLLNQVQFLCGTLSFTSTGCVAGNLTPLNTLTQSLTIEVNRVGNDNEITSYLSSTGLPEFCLLLAKIGANATELFAMSQLIDLFSFTKGGKAVEVLVMPL